MTEPTRPPTASTDFIARKCPNCSGEEASLVIGASEPADRLGLEVLRKHWFGFFKKAMFFNYHRCADCGMLYNKKFFAGNRLSELYSSMPDNTAGQDLTNLRKTQQSYFDFLKSRAQTKGAYLELGPDIGLLTKIAADEGAFTEFHLFEPNRNVHAQLRATTGGKPCHIHTDIFDLSAVRDGSIDVAVGVHVLDHMLDPRDMLRQLHTKLKPGGVVMIVTHDERSLLARALKSKWPGHCLQHPHLFNTNSTRDFFERNGFNVVKTNKSLNHFTFDYLAKHLLWSLGLGKLTLPKWLGFTLPLRLGNIMTVAQKPPAVGGRGA